MIVGHYIKLSEVVKFGLGEIKATNADYPEINLNISWDRNHEKLLKDEVSVFSHPPVIHAPEIEISSPFEEIRKSILSVLFRSIELTHHLDGEKIVVHPVISRFHELDSDTVLNLKREAIEKLLKIGDDMCVQICLENTAESPEEMNSLIRMVDNIMFCLDIGHANLMSEENRALKFIELLHDRLGNVHLSDNIGGYSYFWDLHLPVGAGNINFRRILESLIRVYDETITLEIFSREYMKLSLEKVREMIRQVKMKK